MKTQQQRIGIMFGDNDFYFTLMPIMEMFGAVEFVMTKEQVVTIFNNVVFGYYLAFQNKFEYNQEHYEHLKEYLCITESQVCFDEELDRLLIKENYFSNGELFLVTYGQVSCV